MAELKWFMFRYMYMDVCMNHWMYQFCKYSILHKKRWHPHTKQEFLSRAVRSETNRPTNLTNPSTALPVYVRLVGTSHSRCRPFGSWILTARATETGSYKGRISVSTIWLHVHCMKATYIHIYIYNKYEKQWVRGLWPEIQMMGWGFWRWTKEWEHALHHSDISLLTS